MKRLFFCKTVVLIWSAVALCGLTAFADTQYLELADCHKSQGDFLAAEQISFSVDIQDWHQIESVLAQGENAFDSGLSLKDGLLFRRIHSPFKPTDIAGMSNIVPVEIEKGGVFSAVLGSIRLSFQMKDWIRHVMSSPQKKSWLKSFKATMEIGGQQTSYRCVLPSVVWGQKR